MEEVIGLSSDSRKRDPKAAAKNPAVIDPAKLGMVSDYLKRTVSERPYAFILESLADRLEMEKIDRKLTSVGIVPVPYDFDPRKFAEEKSTAFVPYCCKPFDCPSNPDSGRKSSKCQAIEGQCDHTSCSIGRFIAVAKKLGIHEFHVIDSDSGLFEWLAQKRKEGYLHVVGVACEFAVSYALEIINGQLGFDGLIVTINGDKCKTKEEYAESDVEDRDRLTFIDEWTISTLEELAAQMADNNNNHPKSNGAVMAHR
jgi:hypothetical protein